MFDLSWADLGDIPGAEFDYDRVAAIVERRPANLGELLVKKFGRWIAGYDWNDNPDRLQAMKAWHRFLLALKERLPNAPLQAEQVHSALEQVLPVVMAYGDRRGLGVILAGVACWCLEVGQWPEHRREVVEEIVHPYLTAEQASLAYRTLARRLVEGPVSLDGLELNSLYRFNKRSPHLVLEEHGSCEVPAGCGGVVMRWLNPAEESYVVFTLYRAWECRVFVDGQALSSAAITLARGRHLLAVEVSCGALVVAAHRHLQPDPELLFRTEDDGSWRGSAVQPPPAWNEPGFEADWPPLQEVAVVEDPTSSWALYETRKWNARSLGVKGERTFWARRFFEL